MARLKHILPPISLTAGIPTHSGEQFSGYSNSLCLATFNSIRSFDLDDSMRGCLSKGRAAVAGRIYYLYYIFSREFVKSEQMTKTT